MDPKERVIRNLLKKKNFDTVLLIDVLITIPPHELAKFCALDEKVGKVCADPQFLRDYKLKYPKEIEERRKLQWRLFQIKSAMQNDDISNAGNLFEGLIRIPPEFPALIIKHKSAKVLTYLLDKYPELWEEYIFENSFLAPIAEDGWIEGILIVIKSGIRTQSELFEATQAATFRGKEDSLLVLLQEGANPFQIDGILETAATSGYLSIVRLLLNAEPNYESDFVEYEEEEIDEAIAAAKGPQKDKIIKILSKYKREHYGEPAEEDYLIQPARGADVVLENDKLDIRDIPDIYDVMEMESYSAKEYLDLDPDNLILVDGKNPMGITRSNLAQLTGLDKHEYYYECVALNKGHVVAPANIFENDPYVILRMTANYYVPAGEIRALMISKSRIFTLTKTKHLKYTASIDVVQRAVAKNFKGQIIDVVSKDHCQEGSDKNAYQVKEVLEVPEVP